MPYIEAIEGSEQTPRIMAGTRISVFTLADDEFFEAAPEEEIPHPYTRDSAGEVVLLEHNDLQTILDWIEELIDKKIVIEYLKKGQLPHINVEIFMHNDLFGVSVHAMSVGEETRRLAEKIINGPEEADYVYADEDDDDEEGIEIISWDALKAEEGLLDDEPSTAESESDPSV